MRKGGFPYRTTIVLFALAFLVIVATGNHREMIVTYNTNSVKSLQAVHIVNKYLISNIEQPIPLFNTFEEAIAIAPTAPVSFTGQMTGYGPDCVGCGGKTGCPPRQDVTNGNIYFQDATYGMVRIVATDRSIPCGSMIRIHNYTKEPMLAIALDRGGAIKGNIMDLLCVSEKEALQVGRRKNIQYEIIRWGW